MDPWASPWAEDDAHSSPTPRPLPEQVVSAGQPTTTSPRLRPASPELDPWAAASQQSATNDGQVKEQEASPAENVARVIHPWTSGWESEPYQPPSTTSGAVASVSEGIIQSSSQEIEQEVKPVLRQEETADPWADPSRSPIVDRFTPNAPTSHLEPAWQPSTGGEVAAPWGGAASTGLGAVTEVSFHQEENRTSTLGQFSFGAPSLNVTGSTLPASNAGDAKYGSPSLLKDDFVNPRPQSSSALMADKGNSTASQKASTSAMASTSDSTKPPPTAFGKAREALASSWAKGPRLSSSSSTPALPESKRSASSSDDVKRTIDVSSPNVTGGEGWEMEKKPGPSALTVVGGWISSAVAKGRENSNPVVFRGQEDSDEEEEEVKTSTGPAQGFTDRGQRATPTIPPPPDLLLGDEDDEPAKGQSATSTEATAAQPTSAVGRLFGRWRKPAADPTPGADAKGSSEIDADGLDWLAKGSSSEVVSQTTQPVVTATSGIDDLFDFDSLAISSSKIDGDSSSNGSAPSRPLSTSTFQYRDEPSTKSSTTSSSSNEDWSWLEKQSTSAATSRRSTISPPPQMTPSPLARPSSALPPVQFRSQPSRSNSTASMGVAKRGPLLPPPPSSSTSGRYSPSVGQQVARPASNSISPPPASGAASASKPDLNFHFLSGPPPPARPSSTTGRLTTNETSRTSMTSKEPVSHGQGKMTKDDLLFFESLG